VKPNGHEEGRREEAREEEEVRRPRLMSEYVFCRKGVISSGDEEEASRQEGCPKEKEVTHRHVKTLGAAPPSGTYTLFYIICARQVPVCKIINSLFSNT
jgi:hypothetical protein